jgi:hypothetical protein
MKKKPEPIMKLYTGFYRILCGAVSEWVRRKGQDPICDVMHHSPFNIDVIENRVHVS